MTEIYFDPVHTVTADGQETYHDGSSGYWDWQAKFESRMNTGYSERRAQETTAQSAELPKSPKKRTQHEKRMRLYDQGLNDREIGEALGIAGSTVRNWRKRLGLPVNKKSGDARV